MQWLSMENVGSVEYHLGQWYRVQVLVYDYFSGIDALMIMIKMMATSKQSSATFCETITDF